MRSEAKFSNHEDTQAANASRYAMQCTGALSRVTTAIAAKPQSLASHVRPACV